MALLLHESDVNALLAMDDALTLIEEVFAARGRERAANQPRRRVGSGQGTLNVMFATVPARDVFGLKAYPTSPGGVNFTVLLYRASTSKLLAIIEAGRLGQLRTGAASGVATRHLAREDARTFGLFGAGTQAETQLEAVAAAMKPESVYVYARRPDELRRFCVRMEERTGVTVAPAESPEQLLECDVITTATSSTRPLFDGYGLRPGTHINAIGSNYASKAEIDLETVRRASLVVADSLDSARIEGGDLLPAIDRGILSWEHVVELADVVSGLHPGRESDEEVTLFASQGVASEDVIMAHEAYTRALERGMGQPVPLFGT